MSAPVSDVRRTRSLSELAESLGERASVAIRARPAWYACCAVLALWALIANFLHIGSKVTGRDETFYAIAAWRYVHGLTGPPPRGVGADFDNFEHAPLAKYLFGLAQLVPGHPSVVADRVVAATCTLITAALLGWWIGRVADRWTGLGAAGLVAVLPLHVSGLPFRFGRYGYLDAVAETFALAAVVLAWFWFRRSGRRAWVLAVATGAAAGLATASKENGFLGVLGPVLLGLGLAALARGNRGVRVAQAAVAAAVSVVVFVASYLGFDDPFGTIAYLWREQRLQSRIGHRVTVAGHSTDHPPGWAFVWFAIHGVGALVAAACLICVAAALVRRRDALVGWCVAALVGPFVFHMGIARVILPFYWVMWSPAVLALVALGAAELVRAVGVSTPGARARAVAGCACIAVLGLAGAYDTLRTVTHVDPAPAASAYARAVQARGPMVYLRLDEASGQRALDSSGNHHDGVYLGNPRHGNGLVAGTGGAVVTNGHGQAVSTPGGPWISPTDYSGTIWFSTTAAADQVLVSHDNYVNKEWDLQLDPAGHLRFATFSYFGGGQLISSPATYRDGRPHLAVFTRTGEDERLYVDGQLVASGRFRAAPRNTSLVPIVVGSRGDGRSGFTGTLDEFAYFATTLTPADVSELYAAGR